MQDDNLIQNNAIFSIENIKEVAENYCVKNNISSKIKSEIDKILSAKNEEISNLRIVNTGHSNFSEKEKYKWCEMQYKVNLQIQRNYFKDYITGLVNFYCPWYIYDTKNWDLEDGNLSEEWELALSNMDRYCTFLKKSWIEIKEELSNEVFNYCDRNNIDSNIRLVLFEKCDLAFKINITTLWGNFHVKVQRIVTVYCNDNSVSEEVVYVLNQLIKIDWELVFEIINNAHENAITSSEATKILKNLKKLYKNISDIKPIKSDFLSYLKGNVNVVKDLSTEQLKIYVAEYIVHEELKNKLHYQQAKDKQQTLLETTPHQTLSIETTTANVEVGKIILTKTGEKFTLPQIALIYYYDGLALNGNNCNDIILTYGWNSGKKLREWHTKFDTGNSIRLYSHSSGKRIYSVLEYLTTEKGKTDAKKDLKDIGFDFE